MNKIELEKYQKILQAEHNKLAAELKNIARPDPKTKGDWDANFPKFETEETGSSSSLEQEADEVEEYEVRLSAEHSLESRLLEVNRALERIKTGTYGFCLKCKKEISAERLKANPAAEFHLEHFS